MNIVVRNITSEDYLPVIDVIKRSITISQGKIYPRELTDEFCKKYTPESFAERVKTIQYFIAEDIDTNTIVGVIGLKQNQLKTFFVDPDYQGHGIGRKLYDHLEAEARKHGVIKLILEGSPLGQPVYKKFGFKKIKTIDKERIGIKYVDAYMEKDLS